mmetsp:Transcript_37799/g.85145  ORF Transcript_37799/g.85145 Transcript_37799/m.85145 type:complete len:561 (-) Transcript_37799:51-1733(-)
MLHSSARRPPVAGHANSRFLAVAAGPRLSSAEEVVGRLQSSRSSCAKVFAIGVTATLAGSLASHRFRKTQRGKSFRRAQRSTLDTKLAPLAAPAGSAPAWRETYWFPVASVLELDPSRPTPVQIDGLRLVVWHSPAAEDGQEGEWRVFADACPHRLAPLSEGRIEATTGCLQCAYHGWEFDTEGSCQRIPQMDDESSKRARANPRANAIAYPTHVCYGLVWAWLGTQEPQGAPEDYFVGTELEKQKVFLTLTRDMPYGYDGLIENLLDPSHVPFAHHGLQGTRDDAKPMSMTVPQVQGTSAVAEASSRTDLLKFDFTDRTVGMDREGSCFLQSPFLFYYELDFIGGGIFPLFAALAGKNEKGGVRAPLLVSACIPVKPGTSRLIFIQSHAEGKDEYLELLPPAVQHILINRFLDSDLAFLHFQERNLRRKNVASKWQDSFYMPAASDRSVAGWRSWLTREGADVVRDDITLPATPSREALLDRYEQHTAHCVHCRQALEGLDKSQLLLGGVGLLALVVDRLSWAPAEWCVILEVGSLALVAGLQRVRQEFYFVDYEHYKT